MVLLLVSLASGGLAQWGWQSYRASTDGAKELVVADQPSETAAADPTPADDAAESAAPASPTATSGTSTRTPGRRASRGSARTASPTAKAPAPTTAAPKPSASSPAPPPSPAKPARTADERTELENEVVALTNTERARKGCKPLRNEVRLRDAARGHSADMQKRGFFDHTTPDGVDPWERAKAKGYLQPSGENIARGQPTPEAVVKAWMDSEGHRANILNCDSKAIGVGVALGENGPWWTEMFGFV